MVNTSNVCMFEGRITKDPEFTQINGQNGPIDKAVFDIAVDRGMNSQAKQQAQANNQQTADFIHCSMIGAQVKTLQQYCPKGKAVKVLCHYTQYSYTDKQTGQTKYGHQFDVDNLGFVTNDSQALSNGGNNNGYQQNNNYQQNNGYQQNNSYQQNNQNNFGAPQPQNQSNFQMFSQDSNSPF